MNRLYFSALSAALVICDATCAFTVLERSHLCQPHSCQKKAAPRSALFQSSKNDASANVQKPQNEFSRTYRTDMILGPQRKKREYNTQISAKSDELVNLAKRFSLSEISKLDANIVLKQFSHSSSSSAPGGSQECLQVSGEVSASVKQTCVRTNEDFDVDLEFELMALVRPVAGAPSDEEEPETMDLGGMSAEDIEAALMGGGGGGGGGGKKNKKKKKNRGGGTIRGGNNNMQTLNEMKMREIEDLLQGIDNFDDEVMEDANIFGSDGVLDAGELVAQLFRLKLDPYPKKPGSEPVRYSISG